jgi:purine nucleoside phosphorylase
MNNTYSVEMTCETAQLITRAMHYATFTGKERVRVRHAAASQAFQEAFQKALRDAIKSNEEN